MDDKKNKAPLLPPISLFKALKGGWMPASSWDGRSPSLREACLYRWRWMDVHQHGSAAVQPLVARAGFYSQEQTLDTLCTLSCDHQTAHEVL